MADAVAETDGAAATPEPAPAAGEAPAADGGGAAAAKAKKPAKKEGKGDGKKDAKKDGKKDAKKGKAPAGAGADGPNVAAHPRAARSIALTKSWCGLIGFLIAGYLSLPTSTVVGVGLRAVIAGVVCYVAAWGGAVFVWRRLVVLEIKAREQQLVSEALARNPALAASAQAGRSGGRDAS